MALLTPMTLQEAKRLGSLFGLSVTALRPISRGSVNSNFAVSLDGALAEKEGKRAFLRVCEESNHDAVVMQNRLLAHLVDRGVPTPAPLMRVDGQGSVAEHAGKPVAAFPFCDGDWICQKMVDGPRLRTIGEALATIHAAGDGYQGAPLSRFGPSQLSERVVSLRAQSLEPELAQTVEMLASRLDETAEATLDLPCNLVIHGDVFRDNVLWHDDGRLSAILDFESASYGHASFDLMVTLLAWCYGDTLSPELARALVAGYQSRRELSREELDACYDQARAAAVRFAITRITDYELRPRGVIVYKDYRRFVGRLEALEAIGREAFVAWLTC
jgi:homoserine kinase type II